MPNEADWESHFDIPLILSRLKISGFHDVAEAGCGYGTFSLPVARTIAGTLYALDIDPRMVARTRYRGLGNSISCQQRDVIEEGFGVRADGVLLFNILQCQCPVTLLRQAAAALAEGGQVLVAEWLCIATPCGPSADIRPRPEQIVAWAAEAGLRTVGDMIDLPPWHFGLRFRLAEPATERES